MTISNGTTTLATLPMTGLYTTSSFHLLNSGGNTAIVTCFAAGTRIATERGHVVVEDLREGDLVHTVLGKQTMPIAWIGHRHVDCARHPKPATVWPVRISAGAFGPGQPCRDLLLSPDHALFIYGVLIPVKYLINGDSIAQVPMDSVTYYHVELGHHDVVLAEGLPVESYLDAGDRCNFDLTDEMIRLHPDFEGRRRAAGRHGARTGGGTAGHRGLRAGRRCSNDGELATARQWRELSCASVQLVHRYGAACGNANQLADGERS